MSHFKQQLYSLVLAFIAFAVLPASFWGSLTYWLINPTVGTAVAIIFVIAGLYSCYKGSQNNYDWFTNE